MPGLRRRDDQAALPATDRRDEVHEARREDIRTRLQLQQFHREDRRERVEVRAVARLIGADAVDRLDAQQAEELLALLRRPHLAGDEVAGAQAELADLRLRDVDIFRAGQEALLPQEAVAVLDDIEHTGAEDVALLLRLRLQEAIDEVLPSQSRRVRQTPIIRHLQQFFLALGVEIGDRQVVRIRRGEILDRIGGYARRVVVGAGRRAVDVRVIAPIRAVLAAAARSPLITALDTGLLIVPAAILGLLILPPLHTATIRAHILALPLIIARWPRIGLPILRPCAGAPRAADVCTAAAAGGRAPRAPGRARRAVPASPAARSSSSIPRYRTSPDPRLRAVRRAHSPRSRRLRRAARSRLMQRVPPALARGEPGGSGGLRLGNGSGGREPCGGG